MIRRIRALPALTLVVAAMAVTSLAHAGPVSLNGQSVTVTLLETGYSDAGATVTAGPGAPQIVGNTSSNPADLGYVLFSAESIYLHDLQIVATLQGGGGSYAGSAPQCSAAPGCTLWGAGSGVPDDARFLFSGLSFGSPNVILQNVSLTPSNVYGAQVADITATSFEVIFGSAGFPNYNSGTPDLGTITLDLQTTTVPLPNSFLMMLGWLLLVSPFLYRRIASSTRS